MAIRVIYSRRRKKSLRAEYDAGENVLYVESPAGISLEELEPHLLDLLRKVQDMQKRRARRRTPQSDAWLLERAQLLNQHYFDGALPIQAVSYSARQRRRFGTCFPDRGEIRISERLKRVPYWVLDYVLLHELTHLAEAGHTKRFHELLARYPLAERAKGFPIALNMLEQEGVDWMQEAGLEEKDGADAPPPL